MNLSKSLLLSLGVFIVGASLQAQEWQYSNNNAYYNSGHVGIGTSSPSTPWSKVLQVYDFNNASLSVKTPVADWHILTAANGGLDFRDITGGGGVISRLYIASNGNIGVGTTNPSSRLYAVSNALGGNNGDRINLSSFETSVGGNTSLVELYSYRNTSGNDWQSTTTRLQQRIDATSMGYIEFNPPGMIWGLALGTNNTGRLYIDNNGTVGIGTKNINDTYGLFVEKGIRTRKVKVDQAGWPDYVFHSGYRLRTLSEVEEYIQQHHHLPEMPSEAEVKKDGLDLGDNQATLLKKIEELTLYLIEQNKRIEKLEASNEQLRLENQMIKKDLKK